MEGRRPNPWGRARFLAVREALAAEWQPRNGIERMLLDLMAQAYVGYELWLERLVLYATLEADEFERDTNKRGEWKPPRVSTDAAREGAFQMTERFHRMLIRAQRALRDQRRYGLSLGSVGQLNIGMMQQNVAASPERG